MLIVLVLVQILHTSPIVIESIFKTIPELSKYYSSEDIINGIKSIESFHAIGIIIFTFILWMARRFFASVFDSFQNIFHTQTKRKALFNQFFTIAVEAIIIFLVAIVTFTYISFTAIVETPVISNFLRKIPQLSFLFNNFIIPTIIKQFQNILILIILAVIYKTVPGTKPSKLICFLSAFLCTFTFFIFRIILHSFLNTSNYNLIYGVLGQVVITLMDIYIFFTFFLFFAQFIFVHQFFEELLLGELYLLPKKEEVGFLGKAKLLLFIRSNYLLSKNAKVLKIKENERIYKSGDISEGAFYIIKGKIVEERDNEKTYFTKGDFFGEIGCVIKKKRNSITTALEDSKLIRIEAEEFEFMAKKDSKVMNKLIGKISSSLSFMD